MDNLISICKLIDNYFKNSRKNDEYYVRTEKDSRHPNQIRVHYNGFEDGIEEKLNSEINRLYNFISIKNTSHIGSQKYKTFELICNMDNDSANKYKNITKINESINQNCYIVYTINRKGRKNDPRKSYLKNKDFVPIKFGIRENVEYSYTELVNIVLSKFTYTQSENIFQLFERYIKGILQKIDKRATPYKLNNPKTTLQLKDISLSDIDCLNKDFGEIACALHILKNSSGSKVIFPVINEKVCDFYIKTNGMLVGYSVKNSGKSKGTAFSSFKAMLNAFEKGVNTNSIIKYNVFKEYVSVLMLEASEKCTQDKIIETSLLFAKHNTYNVINNVINDIKAIFNIKELTFNNLKNAFNVIKDYKSTSEALIKFYTNEKYGFGSSSNNNIQSITQLLKEKKYGCIIQPLGSILVRELNKDEAILNCLTLVLNFQENIYQIETSIDVDNNGNIMYNEPKIKPFTKNKFKFDYNGMRNDNGANRSVGYKMK